MSHLPVDRIPGPRDGPDPLRLAIEQRRSTWKIVNYEQPAAKPLAEKFEIQMPVVVLARMKDGKVDDWKRLDEVWAMVGDKPAFTKYVRGEIEQMLAPDKKPTAEKAKRKKPKIPTPSAESAAKDTPAIPIP